MIDNLARLPQSIAVQIFNYLDLRDRFETRGICKSWSEIHDIAWNTVTTVNFYNLFDNKTLPKGRCLNKALHWLLIRCGLNLRVLNLEDLCPENRVIRVNENTFMIIGRYCPVLEELHFTDIGLLNDHLHHICQYINRDRLKVLNFRGSFNHYCTIHSGLLDIYENCPRIEVIDISHSINAQIRDVRELWPTTLKEVYVDQARAITGYTLSSLTDCCPDLEVFSMCSTFFGMHPGLDFVLSKLLNLRKLYLTGYPGTTEIGINIGNLCLLSELTLGNSPMVNDDVIEAVATNCTQLSLLDLSLQNAKEESRCSKHGLFTDRGMEAIARNLSLLKILYLDGRQHISNHGISMVAASVPLLQEISFGYCSNISSAATQSLGSFCSKLRYVSIIQNDKLCLEDILDLCEKWFNNSNVFALSLELPEELLNTTAYEAKLCKATKTSKNIYTKPDGTPRKTITMKLREW